ncbi:MAG: transketolase family protein [Clostridiaceae bacterium]|nr:transketolase family protein [Clostridiaceae bacterium]
MGIATREAYGQALVELSKNEKIVVLDADLAKATKTIEFKKACPERFFDMGISEQDMIGTAAGFAASGKIPFVSSFAIFVAGRAFEQIRNSVCYPKLNVKIAATHAGITVGEDGGTHQAIEDIALMRSIPNMVVLNPSDDIETKAAIYAAAEYYGPVYIRLGRSATPTIHDENYKFEIGKGEILAEGKDVAIIATGIMVTKSLEAAKKLKEDGINVTVVNISTIKPLDKELIIKVAKATGKVVIAEEHSVIGGLGSAVCELLSQELPTKIKLIGLNDTFGQSGTPDALLEHYGLTAEKIAETIKGI